MSFAASRRLRLLRIPIRARAEKKKGIAAANGFAVVSAVTFRPMAFTVAPDKPSSRRPLRGQRGRPACPRLPIPGNHAAHGF
jgi:hypothetical protein